MPLWCVHICRGRGEIRRERLGERGERVRKRERERERATVKEGMNRDRD